MSKHLTVTGTPEVPWFPTHFSDLEMIGKKTLCEGEGIEMTDHPGFNDKAYKERRNQIMQLALSYNIFDTEIPRVKYNDTEVGVWAHCYKKLKKLYEQYAVKTFNETIEDMEKECGFEETNIP